MIRMIFSILLMAIMAAGAKAQFPAMPPQGKVIVDSVKSEVLNVYRNFSIYLPKSFESDPIRKFPVLYLLHGVFDNHRGWVQRGHLQDVANQIIDAGDALEMIIIVPDAGTLWNGYFNKEGWQYETFFFSEFIPYVEKKYRIIGNRQNRAIAGLSMGGGGATVYAQKHPEMFSSVYAMSALMGLEPGQGIPPRDRKFELLNKSVVENHAVRFVENASEETKEKLRKIRWFIDCGDDDFLFDVNIDFFQAMQKARIPSQLRVRDGGHTWEYWHSALYIAIPFASDGFSR